MAGTLSTAIEKCRAVLAATPAVQTFLGIDPDDEDAVTLALRRIYRNQWDDPDDEEAYTETEETLKYPCIIVGTEPGRALVCDQLAADRFSDPTGGIQWHMMTRIDRPPSFAAADSDFEDSMGSVLDGFLARCVADGFRVGHVEMSGLAREPWAEGETQGVRYGAICALRWGGSAT